MTPSARVEIGDRGGFRSGVLYPELPALMRELYESGRPAIAYDAATGEIVGESDPTIPDRWHARHTPPMPMPCRDNPTRPA